MGTQQIDGQPSARDRILVAAAHLYALQGYEGTSIREIADRAGVTKPLVYYHFASKERLYGSLFNGALDVAIEKATEILDKERDPVGRLRALIRSQVALARQAPEVYLFVHQVMTMPGLLPLGFDYRSQGHKLLDFFQQVVEEGQRIGVFRGIPVALVIAMPFSAIGIFVARVLAGDLEKLPEDLEENLFELTTRGVEVCGG